MWAAQTLEAFRVRHRYDVVFSWHAGPVVLSLALLLKLTRSRVPMVAIFSWISRPKKAWFLRLAQSHITKLILPPPARANSPSIACGCPRPKWSLFPGVSMSSSGGHLPV